MPHYSEDRCSRCGDLASPELLTIKRVQFAPRREPRKLVKSRTVAWLCEACLSVDEDWMKEAYKGAPGMTSPALERVRNGEVL